jgi:hypothetical protein
MKITDSRNDPLIWGASCERLMNSLNVLKRGAANATDIGRSDASLTAMMLAGFAFENAFKAKVLRDGVILYQNSKMQDFGQHEFVKWANKYNITFQGWEKEALGKAEFLCVAWGRYPFHNKENKELPFETWGWSDVDQLVKLIHRLNSLV